MDLTLTLHAEPPLAYYRGARPADVDLARPRLIAVQAIRSSLRIEGGEAPNATVTLDNGDGALSAELADPPLNAAATLTQDGATVFTGQLTRIGLGPVVTLTLEA